MGGLGQRASLFRHVSYSWYLRECVRVALACWRTISATAEQSTNRALTVRLAIGPPKGTQSKAAVKNWVSGRQEETERRVAMGLTRPPCGV